jgi:hypothetical protein
MRRYKNVARFLLTFPSSTFALAAPVAVRDIHEVRVDVVDVAEDRTAASQKRQGQSDEWSTNVVGRMNALHGPRSSDSDHWWEQEPGLHDPRLSTESNSGSSSLALSTGL